MQISFPTKAQWVSVLKNTLFAGISALTAIYANDPTLGVVAMFVLKLAEKTLLPEKAQ